MVQVLQRNPDAFEDVVGRFTNSFGKSFGSGLSNAQKLAGAKAKQQEAQSKVAARGYKDINAWEKNLNVVLTPDEKKEILALYPDMIHSGLPEDKAFNAAYGLIQKENEQKANERIAKRSFGNTQPFQNKVSDFFKPAIEGAIEGTKEAGRAVKERPSLLATEAPTAAAKFIEGFLPEKNRFGVLSDDRLRSLGITEPEGFNRGKGRKPSDITAELLRKNVPEHLHRGAENVSNIGSLLANFLPIGRILGGAKGVKGAAATKAESLGAKMAPAEAAAAEFSPAKEALQEASSLEGRITKPPRSGTELRMERTNPPSKMYPEKHVGEVRKQQLKIEPKYAAEIEKDAAERAIRREAKIPKTVKGKDSERLRAITAEKNYPAVEGAYQKAVARVRSLEDSLARMPNNLRDQHKGLLDAAKNELKEASTDLQRAVGNLKGQSQKYMTGEARDRARQKVLDIEDQIYQGKEVELKGYDYSPKMIAEAKAIQKKKKLPSTRGDDFYNEIHEDYLKPYRDKLDEVRGRLKDPKTMLQDVPRANARKEEEILTKMIQSAEAEKVIHNHKLALREIAERKRVSDRLGNFKPQESGTKSQRIAEEKMWKNQIKHAVNEQDRNKVIDEAITKISGGNPALGDQIQKEGSAFKKTLEDVNQKIKDFNIPKNGSNAKKVAHDSIKFIKFIQNKVEELLSKIPYIGSNPIGRDLVAGGITAGLEELQDKTGYNLHVGKIGTLLFGKTRTAGLGLVFRQIGKEFARDAIKDYKVYEAKRNYLSKNTEDRIKFKKLPPSLQRKALKELREER